MEWDATRKLAGKAIKDRRGEVVLATKFGNVRAEDGTFIGVNGKPDYVHSACGASLRRLQVDVIDLYYQHRVDRDTPIEDTVGAMAELVETGKVRLAFRKPHPRRFGVLTKCTRSPRCRLSIHFGAVTRNRNLTC